MDELIYANELLQREIEALKKEVETQKTLTGIYYEKSEKAELKINALKAFAIAI
jgi:hypothetical protein